MLHENLDMLVMLWLEVPSREEPAEILLRRPSQAPQLALRTMDSSGQAKGKPAEQVPPSAPTFAPKQALVGLTCSHQEGGILARTERG